MINYLHLRHALFWHPFQHLLLLLPLWNNSSKNVILRWPSLQTAICRKTGEWPKVNHLKCFPNIFSRGSVQSVKNSASSQLTRGKIAYLLGKFSEKWNQHTASSTGRQAMNGVIKIVKSLGQSSMKPQSNSEFAHLTWYMHLFLSFNHLSFGLLKAYCTDSYDGHIFLAWFGNKNKKLSWQ